MARASGLALVAGNDPLTATTYGTGELIAAAIDHGCRSVIVGVGGSATVDGGLGALDALGWSLRGAEVVVACDVTTAFLDAPALFGPQKGASRRRTSCALEERLAALAERFRGDATASTSLALPGSGAAGGLAGGLAAIGARLVPGFDVVADAVGFARGAGGERGGAHRRGQGRRSTLERQGRGPRPRRGARGRLPGGGRRGSDRRRSAILSVPAQALAEMRSSDPFGDAAALAERETELLVGKLLPC